jgi:methylated-DNA-[protein]-cysteine S-methyltransferase
MISIYKSPIGLIKIEFSESGISSLVFFDENENLSSFPDTPSLYKKQIEEYFKQERMIFNLPLDLKGTDFQIKVWNELLKIPFGKTITYKELSLRLGNIKAIRAVGSANGANPVSIIVPCHRVIGSDGSLTGYAGGLWRKKWLLDFEREEQELRLGIYLSNSLSRTDFSNILPTGYTFNFLSAQGERI